MNSRLIRRCERYKADGNRSIVFLTNEADEVGCSLFDMTIVPALNHFGIPYVVRDIGQDGLCSSLSNSAAVVLAHDGVAASLPPELWHEIVAAASIGVGIVSFDGEIWRSKQEIQLFFGAYGMTALDINTVVVSTNEHYIAAMQSTPQQYALRRSVTASIPVNIVAGFTSIATTNGHPLVVALQCAGEAIPIRRAALYFSPTLWLKEHFGHAMGLDDLLWRTLVWVAKKPFATLMLPSFAVCRVDDASGSYDHFAYVEVLNEYKWIPNLGLFTDEIDDEDARMIKYYSDQGLAQFSAHAFHELGDPQPDQIYLQHDGTEYSYKQLEEHFSRLDCYFERLGITPSQTVNIHYDELGLNSIPFLLRRNQNFMMSLIPAGVHWNANSYSWEPYPYGHQGFNYGPMEPDDRVWNVVAHHLGGFKTPDTHMGLGEFLGGCTVFNDENTKNDLEQAIYRGAAAVKLGVASGFFGTLMTHEQRIAVLQPEEWRYLIAGIDRELANWPLIYESYDNICLYCKDKARTRITKADYNVKSEQLTVEFEGTVESGLRHYIFHDQGEQTFYEFSPIPPFNGRFNVPEAL